MLSVPPTPGLEEEPHPAQLTGRDRESPSLQAGQAAGRGRPPDVLFSQLLTTMITIIPGKQLLIFILTNSIIDSTFCSLMNSNELNLCIGERAPASHSPPCTDHPPRRDHQCPHPPPAITLRAGSPQEPSRFLCPP